MLKKNAIDLVVSREPLMQASAAFDEELGSGGPQDKLLADIAHYIRTCAACGLRSEQMADLLLIEQGQYSRPEPSESPIRKRTKPPTPSYYKLFSGVDFEYMVHQCLKDGSMTMAELIVAMREGFVPGLKDTPGLRSHLRNRRLPRMVQYKVKTTGNPGRPKYELLKASS